MGKPEIKKKQACVSPSPKFPPARNYKWRDAWPGNDLATKHGANSLRVADPLAQDLLAELHDVIESENISYLQRPSFRIALENAAFTLAQVLLLRQRVLEHPARRRAHSANSIVSRCALMAAWPHVVSHRHRAPSSKPHSAARCAIKPRSKLMQSAVARYGLRKRPLQPAQKLQERSDVQDEGDSA
jgi:hypothetical protein